MDQQTIDTYNRQAKEYDVETADFWNRFPRAIIDTFIKQAHGKVLDLGSGPGRDGVILKDAGFDVVCLDASEVMVRLSEAKGLPSMVGDLMTLPFVGSSFDGVWAYTSLLHVKKSDMEIALREIYRILKPGGILGLGLIEGEGEIYRVSGGMDQPRLFAFYKRPEVEALLWKNKIETMHFEEFKVKTKNYLNFIARKV